MSRPERNREGCTVYLLRHGDSRCDSIRRFIGRSDDPLNETGRAQAEWWCRQLSHIPFRHIYCSDLIRSRETARIIGRHIPASLTVLSGLSEIDLGSWDGMPVSEVRRLFPQHYDSRGADLAGYRPDRGESFFDLSARVLPVFEEVVHHSNENLLIVGHAGVNRVILCHLLGMPLANLFRLEQDYGCLNILEYKGDVGVVRRMNIPAEINTNFHACRKRKFPL